MPDNCSLPAPQLILDMNCLQAFLKTNGPVIKSSDCFAKDQSITVNVQSVVGKLEVEMLAKKPEGYQSAAADHKPLDLNEILDLFEKNLDLLASALCTLDLNNQVQHQIMIKHVLQMLRCEPQAARFAGQVHVESYHSDFGLVLAKIISAIVGNSNKVVVYCMNPMLALALSVLRSFLASYMQLCLVKVDAKAERESSGLSIVYKDADLFNSAKFIMDAAKEQSMLAPQFVLVQESVLPKFQSQLVSLCDKTAKDGLLSDEWKKLLEKCFAKSICPKFQQTSANIIDHLTETNSHLAMTPTLIIPFSTAKESLLMAKNLSNKLAAAPSAMFLAPASFLSSWVNVFSCQINDTLQIVTNLAGLFNTVMINGDFMPSYLTCVKAHLDVARVQSCLTVGTSSKPLEEARSALSKAALEWASLGIAMRSEILSQAFPSWNQLTGSENCCQNLKSGPRSLTQITNMKERLAQPIVCMRICQKWTPVMCQCLLAGYALILETSTGSEVIVPESIKAYVSIIPVLPSSDGCRILPTFACDADLDRLIHSEDFLVKTRVFIAIGEELFAN